jgi:4,5-DOPA dioxygenase extradiol
MSAANRVPTVFFGHGSPVIALEQNDTTRTWAALAERIGRPRAIICVSAHWLTRGTAVTGVAQPQTIHDFGGFPDEMYEITYPSPGDIPLARRVRELLAPEPITLAGDWGYDHGCWIVLMKAFPKADVPVIQISLDMAKSPAQHYELGRRLRPLRDEGTLIMGTGNIVHNLRSVVRREGVPPCDWARRFSDYVCQRIVEKDDAALINYLDQGADAERSVPTPEHYWPLLYVLGARHPDEHVSFEPRFIQYGSIDMTTVHFSDR